jgi:hypothetical protein
MKNQTSINLIGSKENRFNSGYPLYASSDDIYRKFKEEKDINSEEISKKKEPNNNEMRKALREKYLLNEMCGNYLDILGSELDDEQEMIGNEDEENNYYSLGGDDHNNLDEAEG